jgi:hypothetical protein
MKPFVRAQVLVSRLLDAVLPARATLKAALPAVLAAGVLSLACQAQLIPNTDVEDTPENRALIDFCEKYRKAVEHRNVGYLLQIAHTDYYEDGGNADSSDDLDRAGLDKYLRERFSQAKGVRYEVRYRRVGKGRNDRMYVDYTYSASYQVPTQKGDLWRRTIADNRLELVPNKESFLVVSGM